MPELQLTGEEQHALQKALLLLSNENKYYGNFG